MKLWRLSRAQPIVWARMNSVLARPPKKPLKPNLHTLRRLNPNDADSAILSLLEKHSQSPVGPAELQQHVRPVTSITVGGSINLGKVASILTSHGLNHRVVVEDEVLSWGGRHESDVMVLANGTLVGWGMTEAQMMKAHVPTIMDAVQERCEPESEEMDFVDLDTNASFMQGDILVLQSQQEEQQRLLEMAAFALGLSRATRLLVLEESLERHIRLTRENSEALLKGLRLDSKEEDILRMTGRLFLIRGKLNLYSELIETPDLYWSEPTLEKIYEAVSRRLDVLLRISIMNRKLDYMTEEQRALLGVLNEKKSTRLEWIIIVLIMVEVCFETFHFVEKWPRNEEERV